MLRTVTLPALRPAIVGAASVVFLFCATAFGIVLTLGGVRYATIETEIYLLTTTVFDLQAAAALSVLQIVVVVGLLALSARLRATPDPTAQRVRARPRAAVRRSDAPVVVATVLVLAAMPLPILTLVAGSLSVGDGWGLDNYRALTTAGDDQVLLVPVTAALATSLRTAVDATWMALLVGCVVVADRDPPLALGRRAARALDPRRLLHAAARASAR